MSKQYVVGKGEVFCDNCGKDISGMGEQVYIGKLKYSVTSANKGESAALCKKCYKMKESRHAHINRINKETK